MSTRLKAVFTAVASERLDRPMYRRIGTAFVNADDSLTVVLDALPLDGRLLIRDVQLATGQAPAVAERPAGPIPEPIIHARPRRALRAVQGLGGAGPALGGPGSRGTSKA